MTYSLIVVIALSVLSPKHILARLEDWYIVCSGPVPPLTDNWPFIGGSPYPDVYDYEDNIDLCSVAWGVRANNHPRNVGCGCWIPNGPLHCSAPPTSDANLFNRLLSTAQTFQAWCVQHCRCTTAEIQQGYRNSMLMGHATFNPDPVAFMNRVLPVTHDDGGSQSSNTSVNGPLHESLTTPSCGAQCATNADCGGGSCYCSTTGSVEVLPPGPTIFYVAACVLSSGGRKREESMPCPCNSTYVSHGCCDSQDGMIWEPREAKMGMLASERDVR